ncbi:MAG: hypothetical protein JWO83_3937 [Caulobacteraceae bacterium]|nr:hypothetical protein [Caulobacteraceae bacterium]
MSALVGAIETRPYAVGGFRPRPFSAGHARGLDDRVALVTGAAGGIGLSIVEALADGGYTCL